ncbi:MAG: hypothetical protein ACRCZP_17640 [Phycicoccus sp.]
MSLTAVYSDATGRVTLSASGLGGATAASVWRRAAGGTWALIRGGAAVGVTVAGGFTSSVTDVDYPLGVAVEYQVRAVPSPILVGVGAAAHADNGPVTPGLPPGLLAGDRLVMWGAVRGAAAMATPAGWSTTLQSQPRELWIRSAAGGGADTAPTITVAGGAAGDTVSARIAAFRGVGTADNGVGGDNTSQQNVPFNGITPPAGARSLVLAAAVKADDWTSATAAAPWDPVFTSTTLAGNDQSIGMWSQVASSGAAISGGTVTVAGGVAATSRWSTVSFAPLPQHVHTSAPLTVTRAQPRLIIDTSTNVVDVKVTSVSPTVRYPARAQIVPIQDNPDPVVISERRAGPRWEMELRLDSAAEQTALLQLLSSGWPVLVQSPAGCGFDGGWHTVGDVEITDDTPAGAPHMWRRYARLPLIRCLPADLEP